MDKMKLAGLLGLLLAALCANQIHKAKLHESFDKGRIAVCEDMLKQRGMQMLGFECGVEEDAHHHLYAKSDLVTKGQHVHLDGCPPEQEQALQPESAPQE